MSNTDGALTQIAPTDGTSLQTTVAAVDVPMPTPPVPPSPNAPVAAHSSFESLEEAINLAADPTCTSFVAYFMFPENVCVTVSASRQLPPKA